MTITEFKNLKKDSPEYIKALKEAIEHPVPEEVFRPLFDKLQEESKYDSGPSEQPIGSHMIIVYNLTKEILNLGLNVLPNLMEELRKSSLVNIANILIHLLGDFVEIPEHIWGYMSEIINVYTAWYDDVLQQIRLKDNEI